MTFTDVKRRNHTLVVTDKGSDDFSKDGAEHFNLDLLELGKIQAISIQRGNANKDDTW